MHLFLDSYLSKDCTSIWLANKGVYLQVMTGHQKYAPFDALPPGLRPCGIIFGGVLL